MISFTQYLFEAINVSQIDKANSIITSYLSKKIGSKLFPTVENLESGGFGLRYYIPSNNYSFRINWSSPSKFGTVNVESVDIWYNESNGYHVKFEKEQSLIKVVPMISELLKGKPSPGSTVYFDDEGLEESFSDPAELYNSVIEFITDEPFSENSFYRNFKKAGEKILKELLGRKGSLWKITGKNYTWVGSDKDKKELQGLQSSVLDSLPSAKVTISRGSEKAKTDVETEKFEKQVERLSYEKQLEDMENLLTLVLNKASKSMFICGRGGVSKSYTVKKVLADRGMKDNKDYFLNKGASTAAAFYQTLFKYKDKVVILDDSDTLLSKDPLARNILKAATDTDKVRKLVWNTMGPNVVEPDEITDDMPEEERKKLIPRYFEFTGIVIVISNLPREKLDPDGALSTRGYLLDISPTDEEIYDFMDKIVGDMPLPEGLSLSLNDRKHVVNLLRNGKSKQTANLRKLDRGLNMMAGAKSAGLNISNEELERLIRTYA